MFRHLAQRLIIPLTVIVVAVAALSGLYTTSGEERQMMRMMGESADQLSRSITSATWHAMLADRRSDAYQTMETIAQRQGIDRIRMFSHTGRLTFSSRAEEIRHQSDRGVETCSGCHVATLPLQQMDLASRSQVVRTASGHRSLDVVTPIFNEPSCSQASCHAHPESDKVLGLLDVQLSLAHVDAELVDLQIRVLVRVVIEFILITVCIVFFTRRFVTRPVAGLVSSAQTIANMDLDTPVAPSNTSLEMQRLSSAFDIMRVSLRSQRNEILEFTQTLESKVDERSRQLQAAQAKLQHNDRLASLGTLAASVAHEINNPISGVLNLGMLMQRILKDDGIPQTRVAEFRRYLGQVVNETSRVGRIVSDLLSFSRRGKPQRLPADLNKLIRSTASLVDHKLKLANIELDLRLAETLPLVECDGGQIQQVVLNLMLNAAEAMHARGSGTVTVETVALTHGMRLSPPSTTSVAVDPQAPSSNTVVDAHSTAPGAVVDAHRASPKEAHSTEHGAVVDTRSASPNAPNASAPWPPSLSIDAIQIVVSDTGEGIAPELVSRIFDPFFTTKPDGKGVGLGLAVSYGIVQAHGGEIEVKSTLGTGTEFTVTLPLHPPEPTRNISALPPHAEHSVEPRPQGSESVRVTEPRPQGSESIRVIEPRPQVSESIRATEPRPQDSGSIRATEPQPQDSGSIRVTEPQPQDSRPVRVTEPRPQGSGLPSTNPAPRDRADSSATALDKTSAESLASANDQSSPSGAGSQPAAPTLLSAHPPTDRASSSPLEPPDA